MNTPELNHHLLSFFPFFAHFEDSSLFTDGADNPSHSGRDIPGQDDDL
jgi:hypothetical protein